MIEGIALPAKSSAVGRGDHANVRGRHFQHLGQRAVKVMRSLRAGPNGQLSIGIFCGHGRVLLDRKMRASLIEKRVLEDFVGLGEAGIDVAKFQRHALVNVSLLAVVVNARRGRGESFFRVGNGGEDFVFDVNEMQSFGRDEFFARDDGGDRISDVAHMIDAKCLLVLTDRQDSVFNRQILSGEN